MTSRVGYRTIVVGYDSPDEGRDALALARLLAAPGGARLIVAHVHPFNPLAERPGAAAWSDYLREGAERALADVPAASGDSVVERRIVPSGSPARGLHDLAQTVAADLLVVGSTRAGTLGRILLGSVGEALLRAAPCAVAVAPRGFRERAGAGLRTVGVAIDGSEEAGLALNAAGSLAHGAGAGLRVFTVMEPPGPAAGGFAYGYGDLVGMLEEHHRALLDRAIDTLEGESSAQGVLLRGDPATVLAGAAQDDIDVLFTGSRSYGPLRRALLGSVSTKLMRLAPCPVLVVPRAATAEQAPEVRRGEVVA